MQEQDLYQKTVDLATKTASKFTRQQIIEANWMPLALLYDELARKKEIKRLEDLDIETKMKYWLEVLPYLKGRSKCRKVWACQALYILDLITKNHTS